MEWLGVTRFIERDEVSVWVKDRELAAAPGRFGKRGIGVNYSVVHTVGEQGFDSLYANSATRGFSYSTISACPEVNTDGATGHNAVRSLGCMDLDEPKLGAEELNTPFDVQRREDWRCNYEFDGL